jgi:2'-hydroxyisoflavone reductase
MKLLVLGGTVFLGRHLVDAALAHGDEVTLFNRGEHNPELFPEVEKLRGNRDGDLSALRGRVWDTVVDTCGYVPRIVRDSATLLADTVGHYMFVSSLSVYSDTGKIGLTEEDPVGTLEDPTVEEVTGESYGPLKALCEQAAEAAMPGRVLNVRAGLIVGPHDASDRFTYWPLRVAAGGEVLAPEGPGVPAQFIDVRDIADWILRCAGANVTGVYNVTGPTVTLGDVLITSRAASGSDAQFTWASEKFLLDNGVQPWSELPLWIPGDDAQGFHRVDISKATRAGLTFRPLAETVRDTLSWDVTRPSDRVWKAGLSPEREAQLLRLWHASD